MLGGHFVGTREPANRAGYGSELCGALDSRSSDQIIGNPGCHRKALLEGRGAILSKRKNRTGGIFLIHRQI